MNRLKLQSVFGIHAVLAFAVFPLFTCPRLPAQQSTQVLSLSGSSQPAASAQPSANAPQSTDGAQMSAVAERDEALKSARSIHILSETVFMPTGTIDRALMRQKNWNKLGLNIVSNPRDADLELQVNRVVFTHIHTFILTDRATSVVLASGSVRALDGVIASGPMAEQIVKILSAARPTSNTASTHAGL